MKYNLEIVKKYLDESDFEALNNILYAIMNSDEHTLEDLTIYMQHLAKCYKSFKNFIFKFI